RGADLRAVAQPAGDRPTDLAYVATSGEQSGRLPPGDGGRSGALQPGPGARSDRRRDHRLSVAPPAGLSGGAGGPLGGPLPRAARPADPAGAAADGEEQADA